MAFVLRPPLQLEGLQSPDPDRQSHVPFLREPDGWQDEGAYAPGGRASQVRSFAPTGGLERVDPWGRERPRRPISRIKDDFSDKMLCPRLFKMAMNAFGPLDLDLFATEKNRQLRRYVSLRAEPDADYSDAFSRPLPNDIWCWANPPFVTIGRLLSKIRREKARKVVVLAPVWANQAWWPLLRDLLVEPPLVLPSPPDMYCPPRGMRLEAMEPPKWTTVVCRVSGNPSDTEGFRRACSTFASGTTRNKWGHLVRSAHTNETGQSSLTSAEARVEQLLSLK